jgi:hypothetical protein
MLEPGVRQVIDQLESDGAVVVPIAGRRSVATVASPTTQQERELLARGKAPPPWWPGAQQAVADNRRAAGRIAGLTRPSVNPRRAKG